MAPFPLVMVTQILTTPPKLELPVAEAILVEKGEIESRPPSLVSRHRPSRREPDWTRARGERLG
jgi:hypothetical protein